MNGINLNNMNPSVNNATLRRVTQDDIAASIDVNDIDL